MAKNFPYYLLTFPSVHHAIKFESKLRGKFPSLRLVPVPRELSSSCGVAAKVFGSTVDEIKCSIKEKKLEFDSLYLYKAPKDPKLLISHN